MFLFVINHQFSDKNEKQFILQWNHFSFKKYMEDDMVLSLNFFDCGHKNMDLLMTLLMIQHSSEYDVLNSQLEGACALVEKLMTENAELVEKVTL